jgi:hypothetical protein
MTGDGLNGAVIQKISLRLAYLKLFSHFSKYSA